MPKTILSLKQLAEDFPRAVHAAIVDQKYYQDFFYLGNVYRIKIKHLRHDSSVRRKAIPKTEKPPVEGVAKCFSCKGPSIGPVCMFKGCEVVVKPTR